MTTDHDGEFQDWLGYMDEALAEWLMWLPEHVRDKLDFSIESLDVLEAWLLDRYSTYEEARAESESLIFDGAARYIGETFIRNIGGHWDLELEDPKYVFHGLPQITAYSEHPTPTCPLALATASVDRRRGDYLSSIFRVYKDEVDGNRTD